MNPIQKEDEEKERILNELLNYTWDEAQEKQMNFQRQWIEAERKFNPYGLVKVWWDKNKGPMVD